MISHPSGKSPPGLRLFSWLMLTASFLLMGTGYFWRGIDFAAAVLLGCGIVGLNFIWTKRVIAKVLHGDQPRARLAVSLVFKFGLTALLLFFAIVRFQIDPMGILLGVSAVFAAGVMFALARLAF